MAEAVSQRSVAAPQQGRPSSGWRRFRQHKAAMVGATILLIMVLAAVFAPWIVPYSPLKQAYSELLQAPSRLHPFGTDELGRDLLSRVIYGARLSMSTGVVSVAIAMAIGLPVGLLSGYYRGVLDEYVIMRITDAFQSIPFLILALAMAAVLGPGMGKAMIAIGIGFTPGFIRLVRAQVLAQRELDYVVAARGLGAGDLRIIFRHILPNVVGPLIVQASLAMAAGILAEASLSYLGLGAQPPAPAWGSSLRVAQGYITLAPWMSYFPGLAIFVTTLAINLVGDGLRDLSDPRLVLRKRT